MLDTRLKQLVAIGVLAAGAALAPPMLSAVCVLWLLILPGRGISARFGSDRAMSAVALAAGLVFMPLLLNGLWHVTNDRFVILGLLLLVNAIFVPPAKSAAPVETRPSGGRTSIVLLRVILGWSAACVFLGLWLPRAFDVSIQGAHDYVKHHAVVLSLMESPLPLQNMFYSGEPGTPYYYYHFFYLLAAAIVRISNCSIALAFALTAAAVTAAFIGLVARLGRDITGSAPAGTLASACVSVVGGWDAIPVAWNVLHGAAPPVTLDTWCPTPWRWHNLMTQFYWCPQHVDAMLTFLLATYWLRALPLDRRWIMLAPLLAWSIFGSSAYLAMTLLPAAALAALWPMFQRRTAERATSRGYFAALVLIGVLGSALMLPLALGYSEMAHRFRGGLTTQWERFPLAVFGRHLPPGPLANFADLPWIMLFDMGLPLLALPLAGRATWRKLLSDAALRPLLIAAVVGPLAMFTLRSTVNPFDYSFRLAIMPTQVFAALVTGTLVAGGAASLSRRALVRVVLIGGVIIGLPVGLYEAPISALRSQLQKSQLAADEGAIRFLRALPRGSIIQGDPVVEQGKDDRLHLSELTDQRIGVLDPSHSHVRVFYPRDERAWQEHFERVRAALTATSPRAAYDALRELGVQYVLYGSVEAKHYGPPGAFENERYFEPVYRDAKARVYRLHSGESSE